MEFGHPVSHRYTRRASRFQRTMGVPGAGTAFMARLHEYQGKAILSKHGIEVPRGGAAATPLEAMDLARSLKCPVVVKIQAWTTGRAAIGGVGFAESPQQAAEHAQRMLGMKVGQFAVTHVLVEEKLAIANEVFVSLSIDDRSRRPVMLVSFGGGSGIEDRAAAVRRIACDVEKGVDAAGLTSAVEDSPLSTIARQEVADAVQKVFTIAREIEARSLEVNPLVVTKDGRVMAADCRITIDDYAVYRHPDLGIDIARELDHPPTQLERIAYAVEQADHRGTFYFAQLATIAAEGSKGLIGFHGAGGGGSMMSMDAITNEGFTIANFTDTSGNPSAAKVYRAARIILSQPGLAGYFGSGSGVASQEQFWSAYGLAKAFCEMNLSIPAVIRLGGNSEDRAVAILQEACKPLTATVEGYRKDVTPGSCAKRLAELIETNRAPMWQPRARAVAPFMGRGYSFPITGGRVWIDHTACDRATTDLVVQHSSFLLKSDDLHKPVLAVTEAEVANKDSELIAMEIECRRAGKPVVYVDLPIAGLDAAGGGAA